MQAEKGVSSDNEVSGGEAVFSRNRASLCCWSRERVERDL